jgi:hypothetical protein
MEPSSFFEDHTGRENLPSFLPSFHIIYPPSPLRSRLRLHTSIAAILSSALPPSVVSCVVGISLGVFSTAAAIPIPSVVPPSPPGPIRIRRSRRGPGTTAISLLRLQDSAYALVHGLKLAQIGTRDLDRVPTDGEDDNVLPRV